MAKMNVLSAAVIWVIWKLRNKLCFGGMLVRCEHAFDEYRWQRQVFDEYRWQKTRSLQQGGWCESKVLAGSKLNQEDIHLRLK